MCVSSHQDTLVCVSERDPVQCRSIYISTQRQGEDVTYTLTTHAPEDTLRWTEALWQHVYNMSKASTDSRGYVTCALNTSYH